MTTQRSILMMSIALAVVYVWLPGGFIGLTGTPAEAAQLPTMQPGLEKATFAMGCFWTAESDFDKLAGVKFTTSGYTGGRVSNPSYEQVARGSTGHAEAIEVAYDPAVVSYEQVLDYFWRNVDPFVSHRQFCDVGAQYRPAIFMHSDEQHALAEASKGRSRRGSTIRSPCRSAACARSIRRRRSHQDYYIKHPAQYRYYRWSCGRDAASRDLGHLGSRDRSSVGSTARRRTDREGVRKKLEAAGYEVHSYVYPPGASFPEHTHAVDKIDGVVAGQFELVLAGERAVLGPGDWVAIPRGVPHTATVVGSAPVVSLEL